MGLPLLSNTGLQIHLTPLFMLVIFAMLGAASLVHLLILRYHWKNYGNGALVLVLVNLIYMTGLGILLAGMALFILTYSAPAL